MRASALAALALVLATLGCGGGETRKGAGAAPSGPPLHLAPATDLAQGAGLSWLLDVAPRDLVASADLLPAIDAFLPHAELQAFMDRNGGIDPLSLAELVIAAYTGEAGDATLYLARGAIAPEKVEASFRTRADSVEGRAVDRDDAMTGIVRTWGTLHGDRAQLATFGHDAAALEVGRFGPLRVAELFAQGRLKRAAPALKVDPLPRAAELIRVPGESGETGDAPIRAFALGPFEGASAKGLGGLFAASTALALSARPTRVRQQPALACVLVLTGGWGPAADDAAERLRAAFDALSGTALGKLAGLDHPLEGPRVEPTPGALRLTVALDPIALARGARAAMGAEISEIMAY